jgi:hypothetical protein
MIFSAESHKDLQHIVQSAHEFDCLFAPRRSGYLGADAALSIPLSDSRILWVFGDTLIGRQEDGKRIVDAMPRNTIALQSKGLPCPENVELILTNKQGKPSDFFPLPTEEQNRWFWPGTGICIDGELFVFGYGVIYAKGPCEALSFKILDSWLMRVRDTSGHPCDWKIESNLLHRPLERVCFCSASVFEPPYLYLLGILFSSGRQVYKDKSAVLARLHVDDLRKNNTISKFEYWSNSGKSQRWSLDANHPAILYRPGVTECSIFYDAPRERYLATTYGPRNSQFYLTTAASLKGPWSAPALIFHEQNSRPVDSHLFYAMRMHPHLRSHEDEMILTYIVNARSVSDVVKNCDVYYPRFLRLNLKQL